MKNHQFEFKSQHKVGKQGERVLDEWLSQTYTISDVSDNPEYQEIGIDRLLSCSNGSTVSAEYKCDVVAKRTGNLFFETISVDSKNIPGWGWSSQADCWIFLIPNQEILIVKPSLLRALVWQKYREAHEKKVPNQGYNTFGLPISLLDVRPIANQVQKLNSLF
jgi:hypothetical protein